MQKFLIINGILITAEKSGKGNLAIGDGKILKLGDFDSGLFPGFKVIDASGNFVFPGGFDPHVHLALPTPAGKSCDDFRSGSRAALAGGTTYFMDFVTPLRRQSLHEALNLRRAEASESLCGYGLHMGISEWNPQVAAEIIPLIQQEGICSFKAYLAYRESIGIGYDDLSALMQIVGPAGGLVMVHCEDGEMVSRMQQDCLRAQNTRPACHAASRPPEAEVMAIERVIEMAAKTGCPAYIVHVSTLGGAAAIQAAKRSGLKVYAETCPQYLLLDDSVYSMDNKDVDVLPFILSPPIRGKEDQDALWEALANGTIDVVSTDHCPFNVHGQKDRGLTDFTKIPNGAGGIEHRLNLLYTYGVLTSRITMNRFVELISTRPAEIFGFGKQKGKLLPGYDADVVIWDPEASSVISAATHHSASDSEIYEGLTTVGNAATVISNGRIFNFQ